MSKVLIVDTDGVGLAFGWRCALAGHEVRWFIKPKPNQSKLTGKGFPVYRVANWVEHVKWADVIFATSNDDYIERLDAMKARGFPVFAPSAKSAALEIKREAGMKLLEKRGIECPAYKTFASLKEAESFVWKNPQRWVFKTLGDNEDKSLSYCAKSAADLICRLQRWQKMGMNPKGQVMLQEFIPGIEMGVSKWLGRDGWIGASNENFEHKPLMPSDKGPNTGEMGTAMAYVEESKLAKEVLDPLEKDLLALGHLGDVDVNVIIDEKGKPWPLEFTCRPGWPAFNIMLQAHKGDPVQWMIDALKGKDTLKVSYEAAIGVVLAQPDFPYDAKKPEEVEGIPIFGVGSGKYVQPQSVMIDQMPIMDGEKVEEGKTWATTSTYVAVVTGMGKSITQARERAYKTVGEIGISNMIYRDDIGEKVIKFLPDLHKMGYATGIKP